jgi:hypothetical protein
MDEKAISVPGFELGLDPETLKHIETYEDFVSYFIQLDQTSSAYSWQKADLLAFMYDKHGKKSISALARDLNQPRETVVSYVRTAKGFPPDKRDPGISYTHHLRATYADVWNETDKSFIGNNRYDWLIKATDEQLSTRKLAEAIAKEKKRDDMEVETIPCSHCGLTDGIITEYILYSGQNRRHSERFDIHEACMSKVREVIYARRS